MLKFLDYIHALIHNDAFCDAEEGLDHIQLMIDILDTFRTELVLNKFSELQKVKEEKLQQKIEIYKTKEIYQYIYNPPKDLFARL